MELDAETGGDPNDSPEESPPPDPGQLALFELEAPWTEAWRGMPEFSQEDQTPWKSLPVHFESEADMAAFAKLVGQTITPNTRSIWFPEAAIGHMTDKRYADDPDA